MESEIMRFLTEKALALIPVLYIVGQVLKKTPFVKDWCIPWILLILGAVGGMLLVGVSADGVIQGILASGAAVFCNQIWKQLQNRGGSPPNDDA